MRRLVILVATAAVALTLGSATPAQAGNIGNEGCAPGYWKNHTNNWNEDTKNQIKPTRSIHQGGAFSVSKSFRGDSFLDALNYRGGPGAEGAEQILLRSGSAAFLNAAHEGVGYPYRRWSGKFPIVPQVNKAIQSGNRERMLDVATKLDKANNLGCPLTKKVWTPSK